MAHFAQVRMAFWKCKRRRPHEAVRFSEPLVHCPVLSEGFALPVSAVKRKASDAVAKVGAAPAASCSSLGVGARADLQVVEVYGRGNKRLALSILADSKARSLAVSALHRDIYARTAVGPRLAKRSTWIELAHAAGFEEPFHLNLQLIDEVVGALKAAGYRSVKQYVSIAKQEHIALRGGIAMDLVLHIANVSRSSVRGLGPGNTHS
jgi:hypothetical protein